MTSDEREGYAWVGAMSGGVRLLELRSRQTSRGAQQSLEVILQLRHPLKEPAASRPLGRASTAAPGWHSNAQVSSTSELLTSSQACCLGLGGLHDR